MSSFARRCGLATAQRDAQVAHLKALISASGLEQVRLVWCDLHGMTRGKTLTAHAALQALDQGIGMVSTLMLKDTSDRTAFKVFEPGGTADLPGFACASNLMLLPEPGSFRQLPWAPRTGWLQCQPWFQDGSPVLLDTRRMLQGALDRLAQAGMGLHCGLEIEFHIYKIVDASAQMDPQRADWPGQPPDVRLIHPGYQLLGEAWQDLADEPLRIVQQTAQGLGLPLLSLEIELGPSQVEAVFAATDALTAADNMVLFRNGVRQALRRAGYHASFMCRPPFANIMSSGWHLHQSLVSLQDASNLMQRTQAAPGSTPQQASSCLSPTGEHYLAGLLAHAQGMAALCTPTVNGYGRFRPHALAPQSIVWGRDNRGAMLRVVGGPGDAATRIENRLGEPAANPYLYMAAQIHAGLHGIERRLAAPPATEAPYADGAQKIPSTLAAALAALRDDACLSAGLGEDFVRYFATIKGSEIARHEAAQDAIEFERREYFSRI